MKSSRPQQAIVYLKEFFSENFSVRQFCHEVSDHAHAASQVWLGCNVL